jgi:hypothetical protein
MPGRHCPAAAGREVVLMRHGPAAIRHAGSLYARTSRWALRPIRKIEAEAHHIHEIEQAGESGETPFIALFGVVLFLLPIFAFIVGLSFAAYYLSQ